MAAPARGGAATAYCGYFVFQSAVPGEYALHRLRLADEEALRQFDPHSLHA